MAAKKKRHLNKKGQKKKKKNYLSEAVIALNLQFVDDSLLRLSLNAEN